MGFVDPKKDNEEDRALPGATGLHLDLDLKRCPTCRRELTPWQDRCPDCGDTGVPAGQVQPDAFPLPGLAALLAEDDDDAAGSSGSGDRP